MKREIDWFMVSANALLIALLAVGSGLVWQEKRMGHERDMACIQKAGVPCDQIAKRCAP